MTDKEARKEARLEKKILSLLKNNHLTTLKIVYKLRTDPVSESQIRFAVWRLIGRGELIITKYRKVALPPKK